MIISDDDYSILMPLLTILPITSLKPGRKVYLNEVLIKKHDSIITGLTKDSVVLAHQIRTISKNRLLDRIGNIGDIEIQEIVNDALRIHLNL